MSQLVSAAEVADAIEVDLKNPLRAAILAWLWPGAGHLYQGRFGKAMLFMVCILVTYFWGLAMGDGHVVYASMKREDMRYTFLLQAGVGLPAMPALVQSYLDRRGQSLLGSRFMAPPRDVREQQHDEKAVWHGKLGFYFELGSLFTMVAGLLNILAVYDAYAGPALPAVAEPPGGGAEDTSAPDDGVAASSPLAGGLELLGMSLGIILALSLRARWELDNRLASYAMAAAGGATGYFIGRQIVRWGGRLRAMARGPAATAAESGGAAANES